MQKKSLKDRILEAVDPVDVFAHYIAKSTGQVLRLGKAIKSPLREEKNASFNIFKGERGSVLYKDFAGETGDIFSFVMKLFGVKFPDAIKIIASDFGVSEKQDNSKFKFKRDLKAFPKLMIKERPKFEYHQVEWTTENLHYWRKYKIDLATLTRYRVVPVNAFGGVSETGTKWALYSTAGKEIYVYQYGFDKETEIVRMYRPGATGTDIKHLGNSSGKEIFGLDLLKEVTTSKNRKQEKIVICAGQKDAMAIYANSMVIGIALNSESCTLTKDQYLELLNYTERIAVLYDNDFTGDTYADKLSKEFGIEKISLREMGYKGKDVSDMIHEYVLTPQNDVNNPVFLSMHNLLQKLWTNQAIQMPQSYSSEHL